MRRQTTHLAWLLVAALLGSGPARAAATEPTPPPLVLLGLVLTTGQALVWDSDLEEYALLRPGLRYRGLTVRRLLIDRLVLTREGHPVELPLATAPLIQRGSHRPERRGVPAGILVVMRTTTPAAPAEAASPSAQPPGAPPPPAAPAPPQVPLTPTSRPAAEPRISLYNLRREVSRLARGTSSYQVQLPPSGGVLLRGAVERSVLGRLGLRDGDLIASVDGVDISSRAEAFNYYVSLTAGRHLNVVLVRNGERRHLRISLVNEG